MKIIKIPICTIVALILCLCISIGGGAQNVGINSTTTPANSSTMLDLNTGNNFASPNGKGLLIPNVALTSSTDATTISSPAYSLLVYNLGTAGLSPAGYYYNSGTSASPVWTQIIASGAISNAWLLTGNGGTTPVTDFLGTTNGNALEFKVANQQAGWLDYTSPYNTFLGYEAGNANTSGTLNIAFGLQALASNAIMNGNIAIGDSALYTQNYTNVVPGGNIAIGNSTLYFNNPTAKTFYTASTSVAIGEYVLRNNTTIVDNTAVGALSLYAQNTNGTYPGGSTAIGYGVLYSATLRNALGTGIGCQALYFYAGSGEVCVATGYQALYNDITGGSTATGYQSLYENTTGDFNTATGYQSLYKNTTGPYNTATGYQSLYSNTISTNNTAVGANALYSNTAASSNTALGFDAGYTSTNGGENLFAGDSAGYNNTTGYYNTYAGYQAGASTSFQGLTNVVCLGYQAGIGATTIASNDIYLGNSSIQHIYAEAPTMVTYSDRRIKDSIKENVPGLVFITKLRPVTYHLNIHRQNKLLGVKDDRDWPGKYDIEKISQSGFIAQQVDSAARACGYNFCGVDKPATPGGLYQLNYAYFVVPLVKAVQELDDSLTLGCKTAQKTIDGLRTDHQMLKAQLETFSDTLQQYQRENAQVNAKDTADINALSEMLKSIKQYDNELTQQAGTVINK